MAVKYIIVKTEVMNISTNMGERVGRSINKWNYLRNKIKRGKDHFQPIPKGFQRDSKRIPK